MVERQHKKFEKEILKLATVWLSCRWQVMGNMVDTPGRQGLKFNLHEALLGEHDYWQEMKIICRMEKEKRCQIRSL